MLDGHGLIGAICRQRSARGKLNTDTQIINELRELTFVEINGLIHFGDLPEWKKERAELGEESDGLARGLRKG